MKKFYVLIVVCIGLITQGFGQTYTWIGGASGNWSDEANWSPTGVPTGAGHDAIFNGSGNVSLDLDGVSINSISVNGTDNSVKIVCGGASRTLQLLSTSVLTPAIKISPTNTLRFTTEISQDFEIRLGNNARGVIDGTLSIGGLNEVNKAVFVIGEDFGMTTQVDVNNGGKIVVEDNGLAPFTIEDYLKFNAGSKLELMNDGPLVPIADYAVSSEIVVSGVRTTALGEILSSVIGNFTYVCPNQEAGPVHSLNFTSGITIGGDLKIENTNGNPLILMPTSSPVPGQTGWDLTINGDLNIQGTSNVVFADDKDFSLPFKMTIGGDLVAAGQAFTLQNSNNSSVKATTVIVQGNIQHTAGLFGPGSNAVNETTDLFTIEMAGPGSQTISSSTGSFDNGNNQLTLRINKTTDAGIVNLLSPLAVGRLHLDKGKLTTTSTNYLTVRNTSGEPNVFTSTANSFVTGPLRRMSASTGDVVFATGLGTTKRQISLTPSSVEPTTFMAELKTDLPSETFIAPLDGIETGYYWNVERVSGTADAIVKLSLASPVAGADGADAIVVARHDGSDWVRATGISGQNIPGNQSTGTAATDVQTVFGAYTFGFGVQAAVLPITLESFTAKNVNSSAQLIWRISENSNPVSFEIMKSTDGVNFSKLATVTALESKLNYEFVDKSLSSGNNYYRLKMLDKDSKTSYSNIVVVMNGTKGAIISSMMPTMVVDRARLNITSSVSGNMQLVVTDISGRVVHIQNASINSGNQEIWLNANRLSSGIFQVTGYINGEKTATIRFFKR